MHALKKVGPWLDKSGSVLVIHDLVDPPRIEIHHHDQHRYAGQLLSDTGFESQYQADQAIDQVIQEDIYFSDQSRIFENNIRADSLQGMLEWLAESWESAYMTGATHQKVEELLDILGEDSEVILHFITRIVKLDLT